MKKFVLATLTLIFAISISSVAIAHGGRTDRYGCHYDRRSGGYHCHGGIPSDRITKYQQYPLKTYNNLHNYNQNNYSAKNAINLVQHPEYDQTDIQENAESQFKRGLAYAKGNGVTKDYTQALYWFEKAAKQGHVKAQSFLGEIYLNGYGKVTKDYSKAFYWYKKAAEKDYAVAQYNLGVMYANGKGVTQNHEEAVYWYKKAVAKGHVRSQYNLAVMYENGYGIEQNYEQAFYWYKKAAEKNHIKAQYDLGRMYFIGRGVMEDEGEAVYWFKKAAQQGDEQAKEMLNKIASENELRRQINENESLFRRDLAYAKGDGVPKDDVQAAYWFEKAASQGNMNAQTFLGIMFYEGRGIAKDDDKAIYWLQKAANQGDALASEYLQKIADEQNDPEKLFERGLTYAKQKNPQQALSLIQKAAEQGHEKSLYFLIFLHKEIQNYNQAFYWAKKLRNKDSQKLKSFLVQCT